MFDFHNHLQDPRLRPHLTSVITAALAAGVHGCCCSSTSPADWPDVAHITSLHPRFTIIPAFGIHPWYLAPLPTDWPEHLEALLVTHPHAAVGESGLCGVNRLHPPDLQLTILRQQLTIAARYQRPVILHGARAWGHLLAAVKPFAHRIPALIAHSFGGSADILRQWLQLGGFVSFSGTICNPRASRARAAATHTPLKSLLIETDAPDLFPLSGTPCPHLPPTARPPNHPANLPHIATTLATLHNLPTTQIITTTTTNANSILKLLTAVTKCCIA